MRPPSALFSPTPPKSASSLRLTMQVHGLRCGSDEHDAITTTASGLLALWPTTFLALFAALLLNSSSRRAITGSGPPTELSAAIGVLHREYKTETYWWDSAVKVAVLVAPQLAHTGSSVCT